MIARWLAREIRDFPATAFFCLSWVIIFAAMTYHQRAEGSPLPAMRWLVLGFGGGESFGDLTLADLSRGQIWRLITCNFIHYSLVHLGLNLLAMYQLGSLLESWYGPYQLIFIYGLMGGGGNLLSALARLWMRSNREVHSAGGSVVIMGMVGLCAVVGWRSGSPDGRRLGRLMLTFIALTAGLGIVFPRFIDNWGHAGGLIVGVALGLGHRWLCARVGKPTAWGAGVLTGLVIVGCAAAQFVVGPSGGARPPGALIGPSFRVPGTGGEGIRPVAATRSGPGPPGRRGEVAGRPRPGPRRPRPRGSSGPTPAARRCTATSAQRR